MTITDPSELQKEGQCQLGTRSQGGGDVTKGPLKPDPEAEPKGGRGPSPQASRPPDLRPAE